MRRKYYYTVLFDAGISYVIAVSKKAAIRQIKSAKNDYEYDLETLQRISKEEYIRAHR